MLLPFPTALPETYRIEQGRHHDHDMGRRHLRKVGENDGWLGSGLPSPSPGLATLHTLWEAVWQDMAARHGGIPALMSGNTVINERSLKLKLGSVGIVGSW